MQGFEPPPTDPDDLAVPSEFSFVDCHVHWWDHAETGLAWGVSDRGWQHPRLMGQWRLDQDRFSVPEYRTEGAGLGIVKTVHVQCATATTPSAVETAWLQGVADRYGWPNAIIARATLTREGAVAKVAEHEKFSRFRGIRDWSDPSRIGDAEWTAGLRGVAALDGVCELMVTHEHFAAIADVARRFPDQEFVLCHAGLPVVSRLDDYQKVWREALRELAEAPNVSVKISALSSAAPANIYAAVVRDWVRQCVDTFGPARCMFGSNFYIERLFVTLPKLLRTYRRAVEDFTLDEQEQMFVRTAERVYRI